MFIRIVTGIRDHFEYRVVEWAMAATATYWGWRVAQPGESWTNPAAWAGMLRIRREDEWGLLCMLAGGFWLMALAINGTFQNTFYSRISPLVRGLAAFGSAVFWFQVVISVSAVEGAGGGIYPLPLGLSVWCVFNSWRDVGRDWRGADAHHRRA